MHFTFLEERLKDKNIRINYNNPPTEAIIITVTRNSTTGF